MVWMVANNLGWYYLCLFCVVSYLGMVHRAIYIDGTIAELSSDQVWQQMVNNIVWRSPYKGTQVLWINKHRVAFVYPNYDKSGEHRVKLVLPGKLTHIVYRDKEPITAVVKHDIQKIMEEYY